MFVSFEKLPESARVWIYQISRQLSPAESSDVSASIEKFCSRWQVHGQNIPASFKLAYDQFLILAVDESQLSASGCSIDSSVHELKMLQSQLGVDFFDRLQSAFLVDDKIMLLSQSQVKEKLAQGVLNGETITFNNLVATKGELANKWKTAIKNSWLSRHLPKGALA